MHFENMKWTFAHILPRHNLKERQYIGYLLVLIPQLKKKKKVEQKKCRKKVTQFLGRLL